jgi:hypothetical protein
MSERSRAPEGQLLPADDPRVEAAGRATEPITSYAWGLDLDPRDVAEVVNAVLEADDRMAADS